ncbi:hypothetical protein N7468_004816 [Penicillium chermesinum]|uniref:Uncharacterized protein n=1 Tax=Penicillium chermesinum TaxID=63820 RepID=A0A9W9P9C1_9EURO|nr:uncharacterized protein N7468_004816 [Penicillium chermesinum]KAJ5240197.1 hypothetical protein N7468_004816 [Penicillium chermesinum]
MAWYSILPPQLIQVESWAVRVFVRLLQLPPFLSGDLLTLASQFLLGLITIAPWAVLIIIDAAIYLFRLVLWELPYIGGRTRGQQRPRAPSLNERPDGQRRAFSLRGVETDPSDDSRGIASGTGGEAGKENAAPVGDARVHSSEAELKLRVAERTWDST